MDPAAPVASHPQRFSRAWVAIALLASSLFAGAGCDGDRSARVTDTTPIPVAASVPPLGLLAQAVGGEGVTVEVLAAPFERLGAFGTHPGTPDAYRPDEPRLQIFRQARVMAIDGVVDSWAMGGLSNELVLTAAGPVMRLDRLPSASDARMAGRAGPPGALWLDPALLAEAAPDLARRFTTARPDLTTAFNTRAGSLADRLGGLTRGVRPAHLKVVTVSNEPVPLLRRLGIEAVLVTSEMDEVVPDARRLASAAREAGATAVVLPTDWAEGTEAAWEREIGLPVLLYDPLGTTLPLNDGDAQPDRDPGQLLVDWARYNVESIAGE